jgi:hypothetical protein
MLFIQEGKKRILSFVKNLRQAKFYFHKNTLYSFRRIFKIVFVLNNIYIYFRIKCYKNARADTAALYLANN